MRAILAMFCLASACTLVACNGSEVSVDSRQTHEHFVSAMSNREACCGEYILITVVNGVTGETRSACTVNGALLYSLWVESGLPDSVEAAEQVRRIALQNKRHVFTFYKREALRGIPITFTEVDLAKVREATKGMSPDAALEAMRANGALSKLKLQGTDWGEPPLRDAVACVFVERGAYAGVPDFGNLWINMPSMRPSATQTTR